MLRRAAPLVRTFRSTTTVSQSSTVSSTADNVVVNAVKEKKGGERKDKVQRGGRTFKEYKPYPFADEHLQLMKKHQGSIEKSEVETLDVAIEKIQWYTAVTRPTLEKVASMLRESSIEKLTEMSDRSMGTLFSSFGEMCKEMKRESKRQLMEKTMEEITAKGYTFGPLTRTSIFTSKVDMAERNEELPSIVDELSVWDSSGLYLTEDIIVQAARVYALLGDRKGVIELTNYARESFNRVDIRFLEWIAFSMISCGEKNGLSAIEKLCRSAPDSSTRLWLSGALAAAYNADINTAVECLSRVPLSANISHSDKNGVVVDVLMKLIERGVDGAEQTLTSFVSLSGDGTSLHERHGSNVSAVFAARRANNEGKLEVATRLYSLVHHIQRNKNVENELQRGLRQMAQDNTKSLEEVRRCALRMAQSGVIEDGDATLLAAFRGLRRIEFIDQLRNNGNLNEAVNKCKMHKFALASQLIKEAGSKRAAMTISVAAILNAEEALNMEERDDIEHMVFKAAANDPNVVVRALQDLAASDMPDAEILGGNIITASLSRILLENDVLTSGRIDKIISSPNISSIRLDRLILKLIRVLRLANREEEYNNKGICLVTDIIGTAYKTSGRQNNSYGLIRLIGTTSLSDAIIEKMVNKLAPNPSVGIEGIHLENAQKELEERGLTKRAQLIKLLQKKSQASARWLASSVDDLEIELSVLEKREGIHRGVLQYVRAILTRKLVENPTSTERMISVLEKVIPTLNEKINENESKEKAEWQKSRDARLQISTEQAYGKAMKQAIVEGYWSGAHTLWKIKDGLHSVPVAPSLALSFHQWKLGSKELSGEIISTIRSKGQSVTPANLSELGELLRDYSMEDLSDAKEWLKKELRLEESDVNRIMIAKTRQSISQLVKSGRIEDAFNVMKVSSENANNAIGHFDVMRAAIRLENRPILESTVNVVSAIHSKATTILDLAYSFLLENRQDYAAKLIKNPSLKMSHAKINFYIKNALEEQRIDVIHSLFTILVSCPLSEEKVFNTTLNYLALTTLRAYVKDGKDEKVKEFMKEMDESTLVQEMQLQELIGRIKNAPRVSSV